MLFHQDFNGGLPRVDHWIRVALLGLALTLGQTHTALAQISTPTLSEPPLSSSSIDVGGFDAGDRNQRQDHESWLKQNDHYIFIIVIGLFILVVFLWYIVRSIKGMRTRLQSENNNHALMMQQVSGRSDHHRVIPESVPIPMDGYKMNGQPVVHAAPPHTHRY